VTVTVLRVAANRETALAPNPSLASRAAWTSSAPTLALSLDSLLSTEPLVLDKFELDDFRVGKARWPHAPSKEVREFGLSGWWDAHHA